MQKIKYQPQDIRSISDFDPHKKRLLNLLQTGIISNDMEESSDDTMKNLTKKMKQHIVEEVHDHKIYESTTDKGRKVWYTYVHDETKPKNRRLIKRSTYESLCDALVDYYSEVGRMNLTMNELFDEWIIFRRDETPAKAGTVRKNVSDWNKFCKCFTVDRKQLGHYKVCDVTTKLFYQYFRALTKDREHTRKAVSNIRCLLSAMMAYAVEKNIIQTNPVREITLNQLTFKPVQDKRNDVFTAGEAQKLLILLKTVADDPYALAIRLDFNLFIRVGELTGLKWEDVDLTKRTIYICHQITYEPELKDNLTFSEKRMTTEGYLKGCTSQGYRHEYLTDEAVEILKQAKELNPDGEYVFMPYGRPMITTTFNKRLKKYCSEAGIPYHSSHKIRFYVASTAYNGENLTAISRMMGHSNTATTLHYLRDTIQDEDYSGLFAKLGTKNI